LFRSIDRLARRCANEESDQATSLSELSIGSFISARGWVDATLSHLDASSVTIHQPDGPALANGFWLTRDRRVSIVQPIHGFNEWLSGWSFKAANASVNVPACRSLGVVATTSGGETFGGRRGPCPSSGSSGSRSFHRTRRKLVPECRRSEGDMVHRSGRAPRIDR